MRFAELVMHVLAHVPVRAPASLFDPAYVDFVALHAGHASSRMLGEDVEVIARLAGDHDRLARVQLLAWLWDGPSRAPVDRTLAELAAEDVDDPAVLTALARSNVAEILRAAAELEAEVVAALPPPSSSPQLLAGELRRVAPAAPHLACCTVVSIRALRLRGRVRARSIWVGAPCAVLGPSPEHAAWQAAHEATVGELSERAQRRGVAHHHLGLEHASLVLLAERSAAAGLAPEHARWLAHLGHLPPIDRATVPEAYRALLDP